MARKSPGAESMRSMLNKRCRANVMFSGTGYPAAVADEKGPAFATVHYVVFGFAESKIVSSIIIEQS